MNFVDNSIYDELSECDMQIKQIVPFFSYFSHFPGGKWYRSWIDQTAIQVIELVYGEGKASHTNKEKKKIILERWRTQVN